MCIYFSWNIRVTSVYSRYTPRLPLPAMRSAMQNLKKENSARKKSANSSRSSSHQNTYVVRVRSDSDSNSTKMIFAKEQRMNTYFFGGRKMKHTHCKQWWKVLQKIHSDRRCTVAVRCACVSFDSHHKPNSAPLRRSDPLGSRKNGNESIGTF